MMYMIIMQRVVPSITLKNRFLTSDDKDKKNSMNKHKKFHQAVIPKNHNFHHLSELFKLLAQTVDILDEILIKARKLRDELIDIKTKEVLLHGDLHHDNILK